MSLDKYDRNYFYGGAFCSVGEIRLIKAIIAQAFQDVLHGNAEVQKDAQDFLDSEEFLLYCKILEGCY